MRGLAGLLAALVVSLAQGQQLCAGCHGEDGNSPTPAVPSLAGQPKLFLEQQLVLFREGVRPAEQMAPVVRGMKEAEIARLAEHFSRLPAKSMEQGPADPALTGLGSRRISVLRCASCHGAEMRGDAQIPRLAAQREEYLRAEMLAYRDSRRAGGDTIMAAALYGVSDADIRAMAHYLSRLK